MLEVRIVSFVGIKQYRIWDARITIEVVNSGKTSDAFVTHPYYVLPILETAAGKVLTNLKDYAPAIEFKQLVPSNVCALMPGQRKVMTLPIDCSLNPNDLHRGPHRVWVELLTPTLSAWKSTDTSIIVNRYPSLATARTLKSAKWNVVVR